LIVLPKKSEYNLFFSKHCCETADTKMYHFSQGAEDMPARRYSPFVYVGIVLLFVIVALNGCGEGSPVVPPENNGEDPPPSDTIPDTAIVSIVLVSWDDLTSQNTASETPIEVNEVLFTISASDIQTQMRTLTSGLDLIEEAFTVATGVARRIEVLAYNADDSLLYGGTKYATFADSALTTAIGMVAAGDDTPPIYTGLDEAVAITGNHVLISWQLASEGSDSDFDAIYLVYMSELSGSFDYSHPSYTSKPGETSLLIGDLDPATTYYFVVRAMDRAGNIDLNTSQQAVVTLAAANELYVDVNTGTDNSGCGTSSSPCKTITYALSKSPGNQTIHVAKGTYNAASGETFPLQLKSGTNLYGEGYWWMGQKVIKETYIEGTTPMILGADNASIVSCYLKPTDWGTDSKAIDDDGYSIFVYHCTIDGVLAPGLSGVAFSGESSIVGSRVENFSGPGGRSIQVWGAGNVLINDNAVINNSHGIAVDASNTDITNNRVEDISGTGISIGYSEHLTTDVLVFRNTVKNTSTGGISIMNATNTRVIWNQISYVSNTGISIWNDQQPTNTVVASNNSITNGSSSAIYVLGGNATITHNNIACNAAGAFVRSDQVIDLRWNAWDNNPPTISDGRGPYDPGCDGTFDICYEAAYALTPEPLYLPCDLKGSCNIGIIVIPVPPEN
jgi:parallel beta-helix repeat protein